MFRTGFLSIISSPALYTLHRFCWLLLAASR